MQSYQGQGRATECVLDQVGELWKPVSKRELGIQLRGRMNAQPSIKAWFWFLTQPKIMHQDSILGTDLTNERKLLNKRHL